MVATGTPGGVGYGVVLYPVVVQILVVPLIRGVIPPLMTRYPGIMVPRYPAGRPLPHPRPLLWIVGTGYGEYGAYILHY